MKYPFMSPKCICVKTAILKLLSLKCYMVAYFLCYLLMINRNKVRYISNNKRLFLIIRK